MIGEIQITHNQAQALNVLSYVQISGHLEKCCLLLSANESYARAEQDIQVLTGMNVPHSTQQRLVHRHEFPDVIVSETVQEMSIDGGKVRLRTPLGEPCIWNDYKAIRLHELATAAYFKENAALVDWANQQPLATPLFGLGDGHDGIWNLFEGIGTPEQRYEILDWYHLKENLYNIPGSVSRIERVEALSFEDGVLTLRGAWIQESGFSRLKGKPLGASPLFVQRDDQAKGLMHLLSLGLRVLTLVEFVVQRQLKKEEQELVGLFPGNPKQATTRPTTERILLAFKSLTLTIFKVREEEYGHVSPLNPLQQKILQLLGLPSDIYSSLESSPA